MKMPGFNAEAALRSRSSNYQSTGVLALSNNGVMPQLLRAGIVVVCDNLGCRLCVGSQCYPTGFGEQGPLRDLPYPQ
jgi:hypothetical protein